MSNLFAQGPLLVLAPMTTYSSLPSGHISPDELPYLEARGSFDWIMTAACCVHPSGWAFRGQWQCSDDRYLPSLIAARAAIHRGGAKAILQIHHGGCQAPRELCGDPVSASDVPAERPNAETPRALAASEIETLVDAFAQATRRAREAGFDGVEIHGANTYLLQQFVSPHSNRREDNYGQDRFRFSEEVTHAVLGEKGDMIIGYRFSPEESETPGIRLADTFALLDRLAPMGLDFLHISLRRYDQPSLHDDSSEPVLRQVATHLNGRVPLIGVGGIASAQDIENTLKLGAHSVAVGRMGIINPDWPLRVAKHKPLRTEVPAQNAASILSLPQGLTEKIYVVPGWFPVEGQVAK